MRRFAPVALLCVLVVACADHNTFVTTTMAGTTAAGDVSTSTLAPSTSTSTFTPAPTSTLPAPTTTTWATFGVTAEDLCVIDHLADDALNVRAGPGTAFGVVGTLPHDATGVHATGLAADDDEGRTWRQIESPGGPGWVAGWLLTAGACTLEAPVGFCVLEPNCGLGRLAIRRGPDAAFAELGSVPWNVAAVEGTGASTLGEGGALWLQVRLRGEVGWVPAVQLHALPCPEVMCVTPFTPPSATCADGWWAETLQSAPLSDALELIGVGGPWSEVDPDAFVIEEVRSFTGPEDANVVAPRPTVERWYVVGYAETDPSFRGRWLLRRTTSGTGLAAVAPYDSAGFGTGVWETCVDTCQVGRPLAGEWCDPACVEDYIFRSCEGLAPGTWAPGDCAGPPPEVLGCLAP